MSYCVPNIAKKVKKVTFFVYFSFFLFLANYFNC